MICFIMHVRVAVTTVKFQKIVFLYALLLIIVIQLLCMKHTERMVSYNDLLRRVALQVYGSRVVHCNPSEHHQRYYISQSN